MSKMFLSKTIQYQYALILILFCTNIVYITCSCSKYQFVCDNGDCIPKQHYCDKADHCRDRSDETNCAGPCKSYSCKKEQKCIPFSYICDGIGDCQGNDDEDVTMCQKKACTDDEFRCSFRPDQCVAKTSLCDGVNDCWDHSDERSSVCFMKPESSVFNAVSSNRREIQSNSAKCTYGQFACVQHNQCISIKRRCDITVDCKDGSDEANCPLKSSSSRINQCPRSTHISCDPERDSVQCVAETSVCDDVLDCPVSGWDEEDCVQKTCKNDTEFFCPSGSSLSKPMCISAHFKCNGVSECRDGEDEAPELCQAVSPCPEGYFSCFGDASKCIPQNKVCNRYPDCSNKADELNCTCTRSESMPKCSQTCHGKYCLCKPPYKINLDGYSCTNYCTKPGSWFTEGNTLNTWGKSENQLVKAPRCSQKCDSLTRCHCFDSFTKVVRHTPGKNWSRKYQTFCHPTNMSSLLVIGSSSYLTQILNWNGNPELNYVNKFGEEYHVSIFDYKLNQGDDYITLFHARWKAKYTNRQLVSTRLKIDKLGRIVSWEPMSRTWFETKRADAFIAIVYDRVNNLVFSATKSKKENRWSLDVTDVEKNLTYIYFTRDYLDNTAVTSLAVNPVRSEIYWIEQNSLGVFIMAMSMDGSNYRVLVEAKSGDSAIKGYEIRHPVGLAVDITTGLLYVADIELYRIICINIDNNHWYIQHQFEMATPMRMEIIGDELVYLLFKQTGHQMTMGGIPIWVPRARVTSTVVPHLEVPIHYFKIVYAYSKTIGFRDNACTSKKDTCSKMCLPGVTAEAFFCPLDSEMASGTIALITIVILSIIMGILGLITRNRIQYIARLQTPNPIFVNPIYQASERVTLEDQFPRSNSLGSPMISSSYTRLHNAPDLHQDQLPEDEFRDSSTRVT